MLNAGASERRPLRLVLESVVSTPANCIPPNPYVGTSINHMHRDASAPEVEGKRLPIFSPDFVLHSLRHTMLTRLGESGVDAFTIMRIAGHSSVVVS